MTFSFGHTKHERIEVEVLRYERSPVGDYYDNNWLTVQIRACLGGFRGEAKAAILTEELFAFLTQLHQLHKGLRGLAEFTTLEEQLHLRLTGDGKGRVELVGDIADQPGAGNRLHFTLQFDQTQLGMSIRELEQVTVAFPVRAV
jgi:hypothetical protein